VETTEAAEVELTTNPRERSKSFRRSLTERHLKMAVNHHAGTIGSAMFQIAKKWERAAAGLQTLNHNTVLPARPLL